ncbi:WXG100 family type VII secretion target [Candidatus Oscillochloris fontis]|uniref:WXG100 family type VII secretion target n=1 Tax=Candidatus Oscillochloris fontis TaxID=2496868 RepID=UPI0013760461|nr:WXG100 family type VII secretion target [Candidatus Oscillochloris fontis]
MTAIQDAIQVNYEQLQDIARRFRSQSDACTELQRTLKHTYQPLEQGGWIGKGAAAFFREMDTEVFPALDRLQQALTHGESVTQEVIALFRAAEEDAAHLLQSESEATPTPPTVTPIDTAYHPEKVFNDAYMSNMIGRTWSGEGDPRLRWAMEVLRRNPSESNKEQALNIIAELRGMSRSEVDQQYQKFIQLQSQAQERSNKLGKNIEELMPIDPKFNKLLSINPFTSNIEAGKLGLGIAQANYMGSRDHLRFGQVVGDTLGVDAVFGAMLNPTGGMPGPGDLAIPTGESSVSYHSAFHDAAGFMHTYYEIGPGYDYLNREWSSTDNPLTGQVSGLAYWNNKFLMSELSHGRLDFGDVITAAGSNYAGIQLGNIAQAQTALNWFTKKLTGK